MCSVNFISGKIILKYSPRILAAALATLATLATLTPTGDASRAHSRQHVSAYSRIIRQVEEDRRKKIGGLEVTCSSIS